MPIGTYDVFTMQEALDATPRPRTFMRELIFGADKAKEVTFDTLFVIYDIIKGKRQMAPFVSIVEGGKVVTKNGYTTNIIEPPLIAPRDVTGQQHLFQRQPGEKIGGELSPEDRLGKEVLRALNRFDNMITRTEEWMITQMIFNGKVECKGEGVDIVIDFGFDNTLTLSGADLWSADTATPIDVIDELCLSTMEKSGVTPNAVIMGTDVMRMFINNSQVRDYFNRFQAMMGTMAPKQLPNGARWIGKLLEQDVDLYSYPEWVWDEASQQDVPLIPAGMIAVVPDSSRNEAELLYGGFMNVAEEKMFEGTRIPREWADEAKNQHFLEVVSRPVPNMKIVDSWATAKVA